MNLREILAVIEPDFFCPLGVVPEFGRCSPGDQSEAFAEAVDFVGVLHERLNLHRRAAFGAEGDRLRRRASYIAPRIVTAVW